MTEVLTNQVKSVAQENDMYVVTLMTGSPRMTFGELCQMIEDSVKSDSAAE